MNKSENSGLIRQQISCIKALFEKTEGHTGSDLDKALKDTSSCKEESELIDEMCRDVDLYNTKLEEFRKSGLKPGQWFEEEIEQTVKEICPEAEEKDIDEVKAAVSDALESEVEIITDVINGEATTMQAAVSEDE